MHHNKRPIHVYHQHSINHKFQCIHATGSQRVLDLFVYVPMYLGVVSASIMYRNIWNDIQMFSRAGWSRGRDSGGRAGVVRVYGPTKHIVRTSPIDDRDIIRTIDNNRIVG